MAISVCTYGKRLFSAFVFWCCVESHWWVFVNAAPTGISGAALVNQANGRRTFPRQPPDRTRWGRRCRIRHGLLGLLHSRSRVPGVF